MKAYIECVVAVTAARQARPCFQCSIPFAVILLTCVCCHISSLHHYLTPPHKHTNMHTHTHTNRFLSEVVFERRPLIVTDYPKDIKAFYMRLNEDGRTVAAMDLLVPKCGLLPPSPSTSLPALC